MEVNYFSILCFIWALIGVITRVIILKLGKKWNEWEENKAYTEKKPLWLYFIAIAAISIISYTWYMVFTTEIKASWIIATLLTLILFKVLLQIFNYNKFRAFVKKVMSGPRIFRQINIGVLIYSIVLILIGIGYMIWT